MDESTSNQVAKYVDEPYYSSAPDYNIMKYLEELKD